MRCRYRIMLAVAMFALFLAAVRQSDVLSCQRSNTVRRSQMGYEQYARDAARARRKSAAVERLSNPLQAAIDREAARRFLADANRTKINLIACGGAFPSET